MKDKHFHAGPYAKNQGKTKQKRTTLQSNNRRGPNSAQIGPVQCSSPLSTRQKPLPVSRSRRPSRRLHSLFLPSSNSRKTNQEKSKKNKVRASGKGLGGERRENRITSFPSEGPFAPFYSTYSSYEETETFLAQKCSSQLPHLKSVPLTFNTCPVFHWVSSRGKAGPGRVETQRRFRASQF